MGSPGTDPDPDHARNSLETASGALCTGAGDPYGAIVAGPRFGTMASRYLTVPIKKIRGGVSLHPGPSWRAHLVAPRFRQRIYTVWEISRPTTANHPTIGDTLEQTVARHPNSDAIVYPRREQRWTYAEFDERVNRLANSLSELGVRKGDRVATVLYNGSETALAVYACAKLGAVFTPLNFRLPADGIEYIVDDAAATTVLFESATRDAVEGARPELDTVEEYVYIDDDTPSYARDFYDLVEAGDSDAPDAAVEEDDIYAFIYTSGTTGRPKGVVHEHRNTMEHNYLCIAETNLTRNDVGLSVMPLYHCAELHVCLFPRVERGATNVIHHEFEPHRALEAIAEHDVSVLFGAPTAWNALSTAAAGTDIDVSSLRLGVYGAAPMPEDVSGITRAISDISTGTAISTSSTGKTT